MVLIWNDTYEDLTAESFEKVLDGFANGQARKPGPQIDRQFSAPVGGATTLKIGEGLAMLDDKDRIFKNLYGQATGASKARASAAPGTAPRRSWTRAATPSSTR